MAEAGRAAAAEAAAAEARYHLGVFLSARLDNAHFAEQQLAAGAARAEERRQLLPWAAADAAAEAERVAALYRAYLGGDPDDPAVQARIAAATAAEERRLAAARARAGGPSEDDLLDARRRARDARR